MGWSAARKLRKSLEGLRIVLAVELMTAARGVDMRGEGVSAGLAPVIETLRTRVPGPGEDRYLSPDIEAATELLADGSIAAAIERGERAGAAVGASA